MKKFSKWDYVEVTWVDSIGTAGWHVPDKHTLSPDVCVTIGQVYRHTPKTLVVVLSRSDLTKNVNGVIAIPSCSIHGVRKLKTT